MRRFLLFLFITFTVIVHAQTTDDNPAWVEMMQDPNANFHEIQAAFEAYFEGRERTKGDGWKVYKRWEWYWSQRILQDGSFPAPDATLNAYNAWRIAYNQQQTGIESEGGNWSEVGPRPKPNNGTGQPNGNGRLNAIAFHPSNSSIMWVGSPSGGLWKTTNGGQSWTSNTDDLPTLGVSSIVINPSNTNIMYIGTGDRDAGDAPGLGVYKSTNGGSTWFSSNSGMGNKTVGQMLIHPTTPSVLLAATSGGIYRSTNSGGSWTLVNSNGNFKDMKYRPGNPNVIYATETSSGAGFWRSLDGGLTWSEISLPSTSSLQRLAIGVTPDDTNVVYLVASVSSAFGGLFKSSDGGSSFTTQSTTPNILSWNENPPSSGGGGQGWYDLAIAVDPDDATNVFVGGVNIFKSTDSGVNWDCVAHWVGNTFSGGYDAASVHADHHWLEYSPLNGNLYDCSDGGLHYTTNGGSSWTEISDSLGISQIYKIGISQNTNPLVINGYQDNGTAIWDNNLFRTERGGDGMECIIDPTSDAVMYASVYYGNIARSSNYGYSFGSFAANNVNGITESGAWVTPYILSYDDPQVMFIGYKNVWRTTNAYSATPTFTAISNSLAGSNSTNMRQLRQSRVDTDRLFAVRSDNKLFRSDDALATSPSWTDLTSNLPSGGHIADLETSPANTNVVWMIRSNTVYKSNNAGLTWFSINSGLPNIGKNCLVADPFTDGGLYVGTDAGVYYIDNDLNSWVAFDDGLPATAEVTELEIYHVQGNWQARRIRAGTYGRGLWESDLYDPGTRAPLIFAESAVNGISNCYPGTITLIHTTAYGVDSLHWQVIPAGGASFINGTSADSNYAQLTFTQSGTYDVVLYAENANGWDTLTVVNNYVVDVLDAELLHLDSTDYCNGDTAVLQTIPPGLVDYTYYRNGGLYQIGQLDTVAVTNLQSTDSISVIVTDEDGCVATASYTLESSPNPIAVIQVSEDDSTICEGDLVVFNSVGTGGTQHFFYLGDSIVQSGAGTSWSSDSLVTGSQVSIMVISTGTCHDLSDTVSMTVHPIPATPSIVLSADSLGSSVSSAVYEWMINDSTVILLSNGIPKHGDGTYIVRVGANGCWSGWSDTLIITGLIDHQSEKIKVYPSPASEVLFVEVPTAGNVKISVLDMRGRYVLPKVSARQTGEQRHAISVGELPAAVYTVVVELDGKSQSMLFVKENR